MDRKLRILVVVAVMVGLLASGAGPALAAVHCVNGGNSMCTNPTPPFCDDDNTTIQAAVNASAAGDTVCVALGTYNEQVTITTPHAPLTLEGAGAGLTTIRPISVAANTTSLTTGADIAAIVLVKDVATGIVAVTDLTVDGTPAGIAPNACSTGYVGIFYRASSGVIMGTHVTNIFCPGHPGAQIVLGIFVQTDKAGKGKADVAILNNTVDEYGKNGITANQAGTFVTVSGNDVMGRGSMPFPVAAQNGVQIGFGARGLVSGNNQMISNNSYPDDPNVVIACGVLFFKAGGGVGQAKDCTSSMSPSCNFYAGNEANVCTAGGEVKGSPFSPAVP